MPRTDTTPAAQALHLDIQRSLSGEQRLLLAFEMSMFARELNRERIRREHPDWPEARVARELLRLAFLPASLPDLLSFPQVLQRVIRALDQAGMGYMLSGSFAAAYHGCPRSTQDIDLVIACTPAQWRAFVASLPRSDYYADLDAAMEAHKRESMFNIIDLESGWKIDLIIRKSRDFSKEEFVRRQLIRVEGICLFVASAEDVVIAKLEWAKRSESQRQVEDAAGIVQILRNSLDRSYLEKWIHELELTKEWDEAWSLAGGPK